MRYRWLCCVVFTFILAACSSLTPSSPQKATESAIQRTKLFALTAEAETQVASAPKNTSTLTAILATKSAGGTEAAATMTALPSPTLTPTIPANSRLCQTYDLKTSSTSNGAGGSIIISVGLNNTSSSPCFLPAWPEVMLTDSDGQPLDAQYGYYLSGADANTAATLQAQEAQTARLGLMPGWTAWLNLIWQNDCCKPLPGGVVIHLILIDHSSALDIPTDVEQGGRCEDEKLPTYIGISKLEQAIPPQ